MYVHILVGRQVPNLSSGLKKKRTYHIPITPKAIEAADGPQPACYTYARLTAVLPSAVFRCCGTVYAPAGRGGQRAVP